MEDTQTTAEERAVTDPAFPWLDAVRDCERCGDTLIPAPLSLPQLLRAATWRMPHKEAEQVGEADLWRVGLGVSRVRATGHG
jgi:hypothetical protein